MGPYIKNITTSDVVEPTLSGDPLLRNVDLPLRRVYHPLGFSIEVLTNAEGVLAAAEESWGHLSRIFGETPLQLRIALGEGRSGVCPPTPVYRGQSNLFSVVADSRNFAVCDRDRGFAFAWIDRDAIEHRGYLRYHFLESLALTMLSSFCVIPLHAACVELAGKGVLLCGNSGAGKSSLAFACARAGWKYISDDASYLVRRGTAPLVVGNWRQVRLRPSAVELFPEVKQFSPASWTAGKPSIELSTTLLPNIKTASYACVKYIVFLNRSGSSSAPELIPFPRDLATQWASQSPDAIGDNDDGHAASLRDLLSAQLLELRYSSLESAVACLERLVNGEP
jgi:hypothetical protein